MKTSQFSYKTGASCLLAGLLGLLLQSVSTVETYIGELLFTGRRLQPCLLPIDLMR
jgi:hypothetical protein